MPIVQFLVDISEITDSLERMANIPKYVLATAANEVEEVGRVILMSEFEEAMQGQSYDSFPEEFRDHVRDIVSGARFDKIIEGNAFSVSFDFNQLGNRSDLERAFHQGALLADGKTKLDGPYTGQALYNEDPHDRHIFWEAVHKGAQSAPNPKGPGHIPIEPGAWERTKNKYIEIWGPKAPEWLYLQFGQRTWEPEILGYPIIEMFTHDFINSAGELFNTSVTEQVLAAQEHGAVLTPFGARLTQSSQELGPSGKPRRPGQFYPRR